MFRQIWAGNALIDTKTSVSGLLDVIQNLKNLIMETFGNYDGEIIPGDKFLV